MNKPDVPLAALPPTLEVHTAPIFYFDQGLMVANESVYLKKDVDAYLAALPPARAQELETDLDIQARVDNGTLFERQDLPRRPNGDESTRRSE